MLYLNFFIIFERNIGYIRELVVRHLQRTGKEELCHEWYYMATSGSNWAGGKQRLNLIYIYPRSWWSSASKSPLCCKCQPSSAPLLAFNSRFALPQESQQVFMRCVSSPTLSLSRYDSLKGGSSDSLAFSSFLLFIYLFFLRNIHFLFWWCAFPFFLLIVKTK